MKSITIETIVNKDIATVWKCWTDPQDIMMWNHASDDWHCPAAKNDVRVDGEFTFTMAAKDGSTSFDFGGKYTKVENQKRIEYVMHDGRTATVIFERLGDSQAKVTETFEMEGTHTEAQQREGWSAILENFRKHTEGR